MQDGWQVIVYMDFNYKVRHVVKSEPNAREYVERIHHKGAFYTDTRGVTTFFPPGRIMKVKLVPPGVELEVTETEIVGVTLGK